MPRLSTIELFKEEMSFSAGHFTIFAKDHRENLHGHNYRIGASLTTEIGKEGLNFDYRLYKNKLINLCAKLDQTVLLPLHNKHLKIQEDAHHYLVQFADERLTFLKRDATLLPITNTTLEELSYWFLSHLISDQAELEQHQMIEIQIKVFNGPGQSGSATWKIK